MQEELDGEPSTPEELAAATFHPRLNNFHTSGVGTQAYASPEQLHTSKVEVVSCPRAFLFYFIDHITIPKRQQLIFLGSFFGFGYVRYRTSD
jgi:hypothetical protein